MNKFIVWDNDEKIFIDEARCILADGTLFKNKKDFANEISDDLSIFFSFGLKDINWKNIYADSSICEISIKHRTNGNRISVGYFVFNLEYLRYEAIFIDGYMKGKKEFYNGFMYRFEIIDTIQENKLGLIK